jgi:uncharacterized membrane protein YfcA
MTDVIAALMGFVAGIVGGLIGVGGGIVFVPALTLFQDQNQIHAEATSLLAIVPVAMMAAYRQHGYGNVRIRDGLVIGALSPIGVLIGVETANAISQRALELVFAGLLVFAAQRLIRRGLRPAD